MKKNYHLRVQSHPILKKLIMELKVIILIVMISVTNIFASNTYSQTAKVTLYMENKTLEQVMDEIERQSEFYFIFNQKQVDVERVVNLKAEDRLIGDILPELFFGTKINYAILDKKILLTTDPIKDVMRMDDPSLQQNVVTGTVTDASTGQVMPGVNIVVKGTTIGAITDLKGAYSLPATVDKNAILVFSFIGYVVEEVPVGGETIINVALSGEVKGLDEVIVIGYGTIKKASLTGSVVAVAGNDIQASPATNFSNTLAGRLPGVITMNTSGEPGNDNATIRIRGVNTLGNNSPLVVIDGVSNRDMTRLDPSVIESVTILKDASAAIYGAQAANGVILITTKRGKIGETEININYNYGLSSPTVIPQMADAKTYATMINEIDLYAGAKPTYTELEIQKFGDGSDPWAYPNTDWFDVVFKPFSNQQRSDISISGGTESLKYFISGGFNSQGAIYRNSDAGYSQVDLRTNIDGKISKNISLSFDMSARQENRNFARTGNVFTYLINRSKSIFIDQYPGNKPASGYEGGNNPIVLTSDEVGYDKRKAYYLASNVKLLVNVPWIKGLSITGTGSFDKNIYHQKVWRTPYLLYSWDRQTYDENNEPVVIGALSGPTLDPTLDQSISDGHSLMVNALGNYERNIAEKHNFKILLGIERIQGESATLTAFRRYFVSTALDQMFAGGDDGKENGGSTTKNARLNYFGRFNYDYLRKYLLEFVFRYDGSYIFPEKGRYGFFPGFSIGWTLSEEGFWQNNLSFINFFKVRGSWGQTGNDRIDPYQFLSSYGFTTLPYVFDGDALVKALTELRIANPNVTWEVANQSNIGFDTETLNGKLSFSAEYFYNLRTSILWFRNASVPATTGLTLPRENIGEVVNQGYEMQIGYKDRTGNFDYGLSVNMAFAGNKIKFWDEEPGVPDYQQSTGKPMNAGLYYEAIGIFRDLEAVKAYPHWTGARPGDIIFRDVNGDEKIDGLDRVRNTKTDVPKYTGGLSINLGYKDLYASILFQGAAGAVRTYNLESGKIGNFLTSDAEGRWTEDTPNATKPRTWNTGGEYWSSGNNTYWLKNNNYLRLKNLQVGYNIPKTFSNRLNISNLSIYFSGLNLLTFVKEKSFDPETFGTTYPLSRVFNFGLKLTL